MNFSLSLDRLSMGITIGTMTLLFATTISPFFLSPEDITPLYFLIPFFILIITLPYLWKPRLYEVSNDALIIHRLIRPVVIPIADIINIREGQKEEFKNSIRLFGSGGFFGFYGKFRNNTLKSYTMHASRMSRFVLIFTDNGLKVITPDDPIGLIKAINEKRIKQ